MKLVILSLCLFAASAVVRSSRVDEDETAVILKSPYHQHAADFLSQFKSYLGSRPTGRPMRNIYKDVHDRYVAAMKALAAQRPTGRPFRNHKDRSAHNHATWQLHNNYRKAQTVLRKYASQRYQAQRAAANAARKNADETEVIASSFADHAKGFRQQVQDMFAHRPTGRPDVDGFLKMIQQKHQEAENKLKAASRAGAMTKEDKKAYWKARNKLDDHLDDAEDKVDDWKDMLKEEKLNADLAASPLAAHVDGFKQHADGLLSQRPTGRPAISNLLASLHKKYQEAKEALKAGRKKGSKQGNQLYEHAKDSLKDHRDNAEDQLEDWDDELKDEAKQARVAASPFGVHVDEFKGHVAGLLNQRPTGRPGIQNMFKSIQQKYQETRNKMSAGRPGKGASKEDRKAYEQAKDVLEDHRDDAADKLKAWRKKILQSLTQQADETAVIA